MPWVVSPQTSYRETLPRSAPMPQAETAARGTSPDYGEALGGVSVNRGGRQPLRRGQRHGDLTQLIEVRRAHR